MSNKALAAALAAMAMMSGMQNAVAADNLFKTYAYDSPIAKYTEAAGYYDCSAEYEISARCLDNVDFLDHKFSQTLAFSEGELRSVMLDAPYDNDLLVRATNAIAKTFTLVAVSDGKSVLDLIDTRRKTKNDDDFTAQFKNYMRGANDLTLSFVEGIGLDKQSTTAQSVMKSAPANSRKADLIVSREDDESAILIRFTFPKLDEIKRAQQAKKPVESF